MSTQTILAVRWIDRQTGRQAGRQMGMQAGRLTSRETGWETGRKVVTPFCCKCHTTVFLKIPSCGQFY